MFENARGVKASAPGARAWRANLLCAPGECALPSRRAVTGATPGGLEEGAWSEAWYKWAGPHGFERRAGSMRPARDTVMAILHLVVAMIYLPWIALHALVLLAVSSVDLLHAGVPLLVLSLVLHLSAAVCLVAAAVLLLRGGPRARSASLAYAVLGTGGATLLWLAGARFWLVLVLLAYPFATARVFLRSSSTVRGRPPGGQ